MKFALFPYLFIFAFNGVAFAQDEHASEIEKNRINKALIKLQSDVFQSKSLVMDHQDLANNGNRADDKLKTFKAAFGAIHDKTSESVVQLLSADCEPQAKPDGIFKCETYEIHIGSKENAELLVKIINREDHGMNRDYDLAIDNFLLGIVEEGKARSLSISTERKNKTIDLADGVKMNLGAVHYIPLKNANKIRVSYNYLNNDESKKEVEIYNGEVGLITLLNWYKNPDRKPADIDAGYVRSVPYPAE